MGHLKRLIRKFIGTPEFIGEYGEKLTEKELRWTISFDDNGKILKNLYIPCSEKETREVDLLCITSKGLLVVESKNYSGFIFGNEKNKNWVTTLYAGKDWLGKKETEKHHFYNPIWQNNGHIKALKQYLKKDIQMISIVVFSERCELKNIVVSSKDVFVCKRDELPEITQEIWDTYPDVLEKEQIDDIYDCLFYLTEQKKEVKKEHILNIEKRLNDTENCPICGGKLVLRTARKGQNIGHQFWGCSNFPKCKYTKSFEE